MSLEIRAFKYPVELRTVKKTGYLERGLQGYAILYGVESRDMGGWKEIIGRGAMKASLGKQLDVRMLAHHDSKQVMAREAAGNLVLREDTTGVYFEADLVDTTLNRDMLTDIGAKNLDAMSFGMPSSSIKVNWERAGGRHVRTVTEAEFVEISVVTWAAYEETSVMQRAAAEYQTILQEAASQSTPAGISRARHELAKRRFIY
jgi:HK97 family phage prohead protease